MGIIEATLLGILQGITEFLPISSSGHLVLGQHLMHISTPGLTFEIALHLGSLLSILVVFRQDIMQILQTLKDRSTQNLVMSIVIGTVPAVFVGLFLKDLVEEAFTSITVVAIALLVTGTVLILTRWTRPQSSEVGISKGLIIGIAQALAVTPGISRSGSTIATALFLGIKRAEAARFSFLLAIPAVAGAGLLTLIDLMDAGSTAAWDVAVWAGFVSSFIVGILALKVLLKTLQSGKFHWFGAYCLAIGLITLFV